MSYALMIKDFPPEYEDVFPSLRPPREAIVLESIRGIRDRRKRVPAVPIEQSWFDGKYTIIGLLRVEFNNNPQSASAGTATLIANSCILTCAHVVFDKDLHPTSAWFEIRNNKQGVGSTVIERYQVKHIEVHPSYTANATLDFDLALCSICVKGDDTILHHIQPANPVAKENGLHRVQVVGFPGRDESDERRGEKWGMDGEITMDKEEIIEYAIDTTEGQSGSPVMKVESNEILGVHVAAGSLHNYATRISSQKQSWIVDTLNRL